ncbi:MAG: hypothetical protein NVS2B7_38900 [Herpetosiphon sp.]
MMANNDGNTGRSGGTWNHLVEVAQESVELGKQELRLARQETIEKITPAAQSAGLVVGGGLLMMVGGSYIMQGLVRALATVMPHWLASLLSGAGMTFGGLAMILRGNNNLKHVDLVPHKTINSLKEDREWLKHLIKSRLT